MFEFANFVREILADGRAVVPVWRSFVEHNDGTVARKIISDAYPILQSDSAGTLPPLNLDAAFWAFRTLHWSSWILLNRFEQDTALPDCLAKTRPDVNVPANHPSVDMGLQYLHSVSKQVRSWASEDELLHRLLDILVEWPLSAVGTGAPASATGINLLLADPNLQLVLRDRILERHVTTEQFSHLPAQQLNVIANLLSDAAGRYSDLLPDCWQDLQNASARS